MQSFKDESGHQWVFNLSIGMARRIKQTIDVDLMVDDVGELVVSLKTDVFKRTEMMWEIVEQGHAKEISLAEFKAYEARKAEIGEENPVELELLEKPRTPQQVFDDCLTPQVFIAADDAFWETVVFFIPTLRPISREQMMAVLEKQKELTRMQTEAMLNLAEGPELQEELKNAMEIMTEEGRKEIGKLSTNLRAELESVRKT